MPAPTVGAVDQIQPPVMEPLFPAPAPSGMRSFEVTLTVPGWAGARRAVMEITVTETQAPRALGIAFTELAKLPDGEMTVRRTGMLPVAVRAGHRSR